jgi:hypothetical protein
MCRRTRACSGTVKVYTAIAPGGDLAAPGPACPGRCGRCRSAPEVEARRLRNADDAQRVNAVAGSGLPRPTCDRYRPLSSWIGPGFVAAEAGADTPPRVVVEEVWRRRPLRSLPTFRCIRRRTPGAAPRTCRGRGRQALRWCPRLCAGTSWATLIAFVAERDREGLGRRHARQAQRVLAGRGVAAGRPSRCSDRPGVARRRPGWCTPDRC